MTMDNCALSNDGYIRLITAYFGKKSEPLGKHWGDLKSTAGTPSRCKLEECDVPLTTHPLRVTILPTIAVMH